MNHEEMKDDVLAEPTILRTAMPLTVFDPSVSSRYLYGLRNSGFYLSRNQTANDAPAEDKTWGLYVVSSDAREPKTISQTYQSASGTWFRHTDADGNFTDWEKTQSGTAMPLITLTGTVDLNDIVVSGIYLGTESDPAHSPANNGGWYLEVEAQPFQNTTRVFQTFTSLYSKWWRSSLNGGSTWGEWRSLNVEPSVPLTTLTGSADLNQLVKTGLYIGPGTAGIHAPNSDAAWSVEVTAQTISGQTHIVQTYQSESGNYWRSSSNGGSTWSEWHSVTDVPAMPLKKTETHDLDIINKSGFYVSDGTAATHAPNSNTAWVVMVVAAPYDNESFVMQTFYTDNGTWWRRSQNNSSTWGDWTSLVDEPSMPLTTLTGTVDLNQIHTTGIYIGPGTAGTHAPDSDTAWSVEVLAQTISGQVHIVQTYQSESGNYWRSSSNGGSTWSEWHSVTDVPAMPLKKTETHDLDIINKSGFYVSDGTAATHAPNSNTAWVVMVVAAPYDNESFVMQTFYTDNGTWWRRSQNNSSTWGDWTSLVDEPSMPLTTLTGTVDLNNIVATGIYLGAESDPAHSPANNGGWYLEVEAQPYGNTTRVFQTYTSLYSKWWRSSLNGGSTWTDWRRLDSDSGMPLTTLTGTVDLNAIHNTGEYINNTDLASNLPMGVDNWSSLEVIQKPYGPTITQILTETDSSSFNNPLTKWSRYSKDGGNTWADWKDWSLDKYPMPLWRWEEVFGESTDLDQGTLSGFYVGPNKPAEHGPPSESASWRLMVVGNSIDGAPSSEGFLIQTFFAPDGVWYRSNEHTNWSDWVSLIPEPPTPAEPAMPLTTLTGSADLNQLRTTGVYIGPGTQGAHAPDSDAAWSVEVLAQSISGQIHIVQTYHSESGNYWRSSSNGGSTWSDWYSVTNVPAMPLKKTETHDMNLITKAGFYVGDGTGATHAPNTNGAWVVMVVAAPYGNESYVMQTFYTDHGIWWRRSQDNGSTWSDWASLVDVPSMPLLEAESTYLDGYTESGIYYAINKITSVLSNGYWVLMVVNAGSYITQTFYTSDNILFRSKINSTWSDWNNISDPRMTLMFDQVGDVNRLTGSGFYLGNGKQTGFGIPSNNGYWAVMVLQPNPNHVIQTFYTENGIYWRSGNGDISGWGKWTQLLGEPYNTLKAYGSIYLLGDAVIEKNDFIPFTATGPASDLQLDIQTGEVIVNQAGAYSVSLSLHLNNNQSASFAISIDSEVPEHHSALHYEPANSTYTGIQPAHITGIIQCEAGQRIGVKNLSTHSVTLRHAVNGRKCKHELTITKLD